MTRKQLIEQRAKALADMQALLDKAAADNGRDLTADEDTQFKSLETRAQELGNQIARYDRMIELAAAGKPTGQEGRSQRPGHEDINPDADSLDIPEKDLKRYSLLRAINLRSQNQPLDGIEKELSDEIARRSGKEAQGFYFPVQALMETRAVDTTTGAGAVNKTVLYSSFIELLRAKIVTSSLGARVIPGLIGDVTIPKQTGGATAYWVTEGNAPTGSNQTVPQVALAPKTVGAYTDLTRKFLRQTSMDAEGFVREDLARVLAIAIDAAALNGSGTGAEPLGILQNTDVPTVALGTNGAALDWMKVVALETAVAAANADLGSLAYVTNAKVRGALKVTPKVTGQAQFIWADSNQVNGYRAEATNLMPADLTKGTGEDLSAAIFGNWADLVIGMWGGLDILVDPYANSTSGGVRIVALQEVDIKLRHAESFAKTVDIIA